MVDNLIVYSGAGAGAVELRLRVVGPEQAACLTNVDIEWVPETRQWNIVIPSTLRITESATVALDTAVPEALIALDEARAREANVN